MATSSSSATPQANTAYYNYPYGTQNNSFASPTVPNENQQPGPQQPEPITPSSFATNTAYNNDQSYNMTYMTANTTINQMGTMTPSNKDNASSGKSSLNFSFKNLIRCYSQSFILGGHSTSTTYASKAADEVGKCRSFIRH